MKNRILMLGGVVLVGLLTLTSCGKEKEKEVISASEILSVSDKEVITNQNTTDEGKTDRNENDYSSEVERYEAFLNNEEPVFLDRVLKGGFYSDLGYQDFATSFNKGQAYFLSEIVQQYSSGESHFYEREIIPENISYSIIDCGLDGINELAVFIGDSEEYIGDTANILVIKEIEDSLQVLFWKQHSYRSYGELNECGYYVITGSNGAASHETMNYYIDATGDVQFIYDCEECVGVMSLYIPDNEEYNIVAAEQGIDENIGYVRYAFDAFGERDTYDNYLKNCSWYYYALESQFYQEIEDDTIYNSDSPYRIFWNSTGLPLSTKDDILDFIDKKYMSLGITERIKNAPAVSWKDISEEQREKIFEWKTEDFHFSGVPYSYEIYNPSWGYYLADSTREASTKLTLALKSEEKNQITDTDIWYAKMGVDMQYWLNPQDENYCYSYFGGVYGYNTMKIMDLGTFDTLYILDFNQYHDSPSYSTGNPFTEEGIRWSIAKDGVLYVSTFHSTYKDDEPNNGYITALDINNDFEVIWKSDPLVCNSNNFVLYEDAIICGYGFTDEPDYLYILDANTGKKVQSYPLKTAAEYLYLKDTELYVRTYNTDCIFTLQ